MRAVNAADDTAHGFGTHRYIDVIAFFQFHIVPAVAFFDGKRKVDRQNFAVPDNDTVLIIRGIQHLIVKVADSGTSGFGKEISQTHPVGNNEHPRIVHRSGNSGGLTSYINGKNSEFRIFDILSIDFFDFFRSLLQRQSGDLYLTGKHHPDRTVRSYQRFHDQIGVIVNPYTDLVARIDPVNRFFLFIEFFQKFQLAAFIFIGQSGLINHSAGQIVYIRELLKVSGITVVASGQREDPPQHKS